MPPFPAAPHLLRLLQIKPSAIRPSNAALAAVLALAVTGCATVPKGAENPKDPLQSLNRGVYQFNDAVDHAVLKPVAQGYRWVTPSFVRTGVRNFFANLNDVQVTVNDLLQGKVRQGGQDALRFAVNSTFGVLGFVDVASRTGLEKHNEDFGQTLGVWGVGPGPYLVLPLFGPSTVRDTVGRVGDLPESPSIAFTHWSSAHRLELFGVDAVSAREGLLDTEDLIDDAMVGNDRYNFIRDAFLQRRQSLVYDGHPPADPDDLLEDDTAPARKP